MVAPVRRSAILLGKCLGGMTAGTFQALMMLVIGAVAGVPITPTPVVTMMLETLLIAFAVTALGSPSRHGMKSIQAFMAIMQVVLFPVVLRRARSPAARAPGVVEVLTRFDPLTYAVTPLRVAVLEASGQGRARADGDVGRFRRADLARPRDRGRLCDPRATCRSAELRRTDA